MGISTLAKRIELLRNLSVRVDVVDESSTLALSKELQSALAKIPRPRDRLTVLDAADEDSPAVRQWFRALPIRLEEPVIVIWPADQAAIRVTFGEFVDNYDDLWYPAAD